MYVLDENLKLYATPRQWEMLEALAQYGSTRAASRAMGINEKSVWKAKKVVERKAAIHGYSPDHDLRNPCPPGYIVKGTSTLRDARTGEAKLIWEKTSISDSAREDLIRAMIDGFRDELPRVEPVPPQKTHLDDLLVCYPIGDHHVGMLAWGEETGDADYDIAISEKMLCSAMDHLVSISYPAKEALIIVLGDFAHWDGVIPQTPTNKHPLDADSRHPKVVRAIIRMLRRSIASALEKHETVNVIIEPGNHDLASAIWIMESLAAVFENEPRAKINTSPRHYHCHQFGKVMIGSHHGHGSKLDNLPILFATDWPEIWGQTRHRYLHTGHVHHDRARDISGVMVESHGILPPTDAYAAHAGYRSRRSMKAITYHREHGEMGRTIITPEMMAGQ